MPNLVGIGNSQVPTNAMLGGLAYQDSVGEIDIDKIKAKIGDNAVDIFVYDTRKDSDGGAWRHRTQHLSWYNEGAGPLRGARKEFPAVAILVLQSLKLTIYDGDDPNLPMWMVVTGANNNYAIETAATCTAALNGIVCIGCGGNGHDFYYVNFLRDSAYEYSNGGHNRFADNIATRSSHTRNASVSSSVIISRKINDVAMTVLPDAPIDQITGLPVPTIAVATNDGVSIIKNTDGTESNTVVDIVYTSSPDTQYVNFRESDNAIVMSMDSNASYVHVIYDIPTSDISGSHQYQKEAIDDEFYRTGSSQDWNQEVFIFAASPFGSSVRIAGDVISGNKGLNVLAPNRNNIATDTMVANITSSYNTGYMHGDNQLAYLADTDSTDVSDTELVTNYNFTNGITGWTTQLNGASGGSPGITVSSNKLVFQQGSSNSVWLVAYQTITTVVGKRYLLDINIASTNNSANWRVYAGGVKILGYPDYLNQGSHTAEFVATSTSTMIQIQQGGSANTSGEVNSLSVLTMERNRQSNSNNLQISGTITKNPVATGAELVSYSFANQSSYLTMPYDTNIVNVGTGDFSVMGWFYNSPRGMTYFDIANSANPRFFVAQMFNSDNFWFYMNAGSGGASWTTGGSGVELKTYWQFIAVKRVGTTFSYSFNGKDFVSQTTAGWGGNMSGSPFITVGQNYTHTSSAATGQMALWRFSHTDISIGQVKKIYFDERKLFAENAKCTLYGSSDSVTGLAYDDKTNIIHAGTSAGRSEFQGIQRINNTTTAVTTAISASDGLVAEQ